MPSSGQSFETTIINAPGFARLKTAVIIKSQQGKFVECTIPPLDHDAIVMIEPTWTTSGSLKVARAIVNVLAGNSKISVFLTNWDAQEINIAERGLIAQIVEVEVEDQGQKADIYKAKSWTEEQLK
jgi:hypothetical protein